jgi:hypothetical protein
MAVAEWVSRVTRPATVRQSYRTQTTWTICGVSQGARSSLNRIGTYQTGHDPSRVVVVSGDDGLDLVVKQRPPGRLLPLWR